MGLELIIGSGIVGSIIVYMLFQLGRTQGRSHFLLQLFLILLLGGVLLTIGKAVVDEEDHCSIRVANESVDGSVTTYEYDRFCFENETTTATTFFKITLWFLRFVALYIGVYFVYELLKYFGVIAASSYKKK